jgi:hypothetical protein
MSHQYIPRVINLESQDYHVVRRGADQRGLGEKGFSAALRMIIREWQEFQLQDPSQMTAEDIHRVLIDLGLLEESLPS